MMSFDLEDINSTSQKNHESELPANASNPINFMVLVTMGGEISSCGHNVGPMAA